MTKVTNIYIDTAGFTNEHGQSIKVGDIMTPEKEELIVSSAASGLLASRLISTAAYRVIKNAIHDYRVANDTQP